jgi:hypothetical protein
MLRKASWRFFVDEATMDWCYQALQLPQQALFWRLRLVTGQQFNPDVNGFFPIFTRQWNRMA